MSDTDDPPTSLEDIGAGLLNGAMVTLLGAAVPSVIAWQVVAQLSGRLPDLQALSVALPPVDFSAMPADERRAIIRDSVNAIPLLLGGFWAIKWGVGHIRENLALLRVRRDRR